MDAVLKDPGKAEAQLVQMLLNDLTDSNFRLSSKILNTHTCVFILLRSIGQYWTEGLIWLYKGIKNVISRSWFEYWIIKPVLKNICNIYDESIRVMCETKYRNRHKNLGKVYSSWFSWDKVFCFEICIFLTVKVEEINILQFNLITLLTCNLKHLVIWVS